VPVRFSVPFGGIRLHRLSHCYFSQAFRLLIFHLVFAVCHNAGCSGSCKLALVWSYSPAWGCSQTPPGALVAPLPYAECLPLSDFSEARKMMMMEGNHAVPRERERGSRCMAAVGHDGGSRYPGNGRESHAAAWLRTATMEDHRVPRKP